MERKRITKSCSTSLEAREMQTELKVRHHFPSFDRQKNKMFLDNGVTSPLFLGIWEDKNVKFSFTAKKMYIICIFKTLDYIMEQLLKYFPLFGIYSIEIRM